MSDNTSAKDQIDAAVNWFSNNAKTLFIGLIVVVVAGLGVIGYNNHLESQEKKAYAEFYAVEKKFDNILKELQGDGDKPNPIDYSVATFDKHFKDTSVEMERFIDGNVGKSAAILAAMDMAEMYTRFQQPKKATTVLGKVEATINPGTLAGSLFFLEYGRMLIEDGQFEKVEPVLNKVINNKEAKYMHPLAMLNLALSYMKLEKNDQARELFTRISEEFSDTEPGRAAGVYLKLLSKKSS